MGLKDKIFGDKGSSGCCCGTRIVGLRQINVNGRSVGIMGLDETLQEFFKKGKKPEDSTGNELVEELKKLNFIAEGGRGDVQKGLFSRIPEVLGGQEEIRFHYLEPARNL